MGQVPESMERAFTSYLIIGGGRVARHFSHYFDLESIPYAAWSRVQGAQALTKAIASASHILLLISDAQIDRFYLEHRDKLADKSCVHFSGSLVSQHLPSAHPLMTFSDSLYDRESYLRLPFVLERGRGEMPALLPKLTNPSLAIDPAAKGRYHALCVMGGNFTVLLWEKVFREFEECLGLPKQILLPYLLQITENLALAPSSKSVLTGPLARGDSATVAAHLKVLGDDPFAKVYRAFAEAHAHRPEKRPKEHK